jgi:hypothetical protein
MTIMDLIFLASVLASFVTFAVAATFALRGNHMQALRLLRNYTACAVLYLLASVIVSFLKPQRVILLGNPWCFDDWCLTVEGVARVPNESYALYRIDMNISSRAARSAQRAKGAWLYLVDEHGHRYSPEPDPSAPPLDVLLQPHESVSTSRTFRVPAKVASLGLVTGHGSPYCGPMSFLVIGESGCLFGRPTMIRIQ